MEGNDGKKITDKLDAALSREEDLLGKALLMSMKRHNDNPTKKNRVDMEDARKALQEYRDGKAASSGASFKNLLEVLDYLKTEGWKIEKSKLYKDARKIGKQKDGVYTQKDVDEYARLCLQKIDGSDENITDLARKKAEVELKILEEKEREARRENEIEEGKWVLKSDAEKLHTAKLALFLTATDNFIAGGRLEEAIEIIAGDREKASEFRAFIKKHFREMLGEYAKQPAFTVPHKTIDETEEIKANANTN